MLERKRDLIGKAKSIVSDSALSIAALVIVNCIAQFLVYPVWSRAFDAEKYGNIIYVMSLMNTFSVSIGVAANYARMTESSKGVSHKGDYNVVLLTFSPLVGILCYVLIRLSNLGMPTGDSALAAVLSVVTMWRYYADVEYRLSLNYKGYFLYYLTIGVGYLLGYGLFLMTKLWPLALIPGEMMGLLLVFARGDTFRGDAAHKSAFFLHNCKTILLLVLTNVINNAIFNGDRLLLQLMLNGAAVTLYYLASLVGKTMSLITTPLNSVIIGYLARYKGNIQKKTVHLIFLTTLVCIALGTGAAIIGSHILIRLLYPRNYADAKAYFLIANLTQVVYFISNIITTILLRFAKINRQLIIDTVYAVLFLLLCPTAAHFYGFPGFCTALLIVNFVRYFVGIYCCYQSLRKHGIKS